VFPKDLNRRPGRGLACPPVPGRPSSFRCALLAVAILCGIALTAVGASAGTGRAKHQWRAHGIKTYATGGTLPLKTGIFDPFLFSDFSDPQDGQALALTRSAGATYLRIVASWQALAPATRPTGFVATDPTSPGYQWGWLDNIVSSAEAAGLTPILNIASPPAWALATPATRGNAGTPNITMLGQFATALAVHYDGLNGALPAHVFQVWNEPNLSLDLAPVSAAHYRSMVNAVADSVHAVDAGNLVVAGGLDPFGHPKSKKEKWYSTAPLAFMRSLLCLSKGAHPRATCHNPVRFDVWSHHPYTFRGPFGHAKLPDDVSLGDLPKMSALLKAAVRLHHVVSAHPIQFWVTEFGWATAPPRAHAAPMALAVRWTAESLYQMWRSGVSMATWFDLVDLASPSPYQSGLYLHAPTLAHARAKPVRTAFRFPFVAYLGRGTVQVWGRDATSDKQLVTIQGRHGPHGGWRVVARVRTNRWGILRAALRLNTAKGDWLRAVAPGSGYSSAFSLTVPKNESAPFGPWGN